MGNKAQSAALSVRSAKPVCTVLLVIGQSQSCEQPVVIGFTPQPLPNKKASFIPIVTLDGFLICLAARRSRRVDMDAILAEEIKKEVNCRNRSITPICRGL